MKSRILPCALAAAFAALTSTAHAKPAKKDASSAKSDAQFDQFESEMGKDKAKPAFDPLRGYNRFMFQVNDKFYFWLGKPLTTVYSFILPQPVRTAVARAFDNLWFPLRFVNSGLEGNFNGAGREITRFTVNSTVGLGGLFDPAGSWMHIRPNEVDLGITLGKWGVGDGFPFVLPILGQTNLRDGIGMAPNFLFNPVYYVTSYTNYLAVSGGEKFNYLSLHGAEYEKIKKDALDPYTFIRDGYKQVRDKKIKE